MTVVARLEAVLSANTAQFERAMSTSETRMQKTRKAAGIAGAAIVGGLAYGLEKSVHAAVSAEASQARLVQAFHAAHLSAAVYEKSIEAVEKRSRALGFTNEQARQAIGTLVTATGSYTQSVKQMAVAEDLARFKGVDLAEATKALAMLHAGSTRALKQLGLQIVRVTKAEDDVHHAFKKHSGAAYDAALATAKLHDKQATAASTLALVTQKVHGQSDAFSKTAAGSMAQFHAQIENLQVKMGTAFLPVLAKVAGKLAQFADYLSKHTTLAKILALALAGLGLALGALSIASTIAALDMSAFWIAATAGLVVIIPALIALVYEVIKHWDAIKKAVFDALDAVKGAISGAWNWIKNATTGAWDAIHSTISGAVSAVLGFLRSNWPLILGIMTGPIGLAIVEIIKHKDQLVSIFTNLPGQIAGAFSAGYHFVKDAIIGLFGKVIGWVKGVLGISSPSSVFHEIGQNLVHGFISGVGSMAGALEHAVVKMVKDFVNPFGGPPGYSPGRGGAGGSSTGRSGQNRAIGRSMAASHGWTGPEWNALDRLWQQESGWDQYAKNASSGAYGIPQALPPTKMPHAAQAGGGSSASAQIGWGLGYIASRYGDPLRAWAHEQQFNWYDKGGWLPTGMSLALNNTGRPERVVPPGGGDTVIVQVGPEEVARVVFDQIRGKARVFMRNNGRPAFGGA